MEQELNDDPADDEDCVIHDHPVPPEMLKRYSPERDPDAEEDIAGYVRSQARDEEIQHVERVKTEYILGEPYEVWDVTTDQNRWWVITNLTNLYSQKHFPSLDYTLSFHVGLMARLQTNSDGTSGEPSPFEEVLRRQDQAGDLIERAVEPEDFQAVGMQLRECLISLMAALRRRVELPADAERPQDANVIAWSALLFSHLCAGGRNKELRQYLKSAAEKTWQLVNWLTHDRDANKTAALIASEAVGALVMHSLRLLSRERADRVDQCPECGSRNLRTFFDQSIEPDGGYFESCGFCRWTGNPRAGVDDKEAKEEGVTP